MGTLHAEFCTFMIISCLSVLRKVHSSDKFVEGLKAHILCSKRFFRKSCRVLDNVEKYGRTRQATDDKIIRRMLFARWITKAIDTHSEYVIL